jgi:cyanophycin synthetase
LFGPSVWTSGPGAVLDAALDPMLGDAELDRWRTGVRAMAHALGWATEPKVQRYRDRAILAFESPIDALMTATLVNEWAWTVAATDGERRAAAIYSEDAPDVPPLSVEQTLAIVSARAALAVEANPQAIDLQQRALQEGVPYLFDDDGISAGYGVRSRSWHPRELPKPDDISWRELGTIPVALITGSNGKTTTVRLVAAMLARAGHTVGYCCSDGVFIAGDCAERGDWSGPAGARMVLRDRRVTAAVLETARGGMLRRGVVVPHADVAIVTNIAEDHFGGYGIESLGDLALVKLGVAHALGGDSVLVLNADDRTLSDTGRTFASRVDWFNEGEAGSITPPPAEMPLALGGAARHNVANAVGAAHVATAMGVSRTVIDETLRAFGRDNADNAGRLEQFDVRGVRVWVDYAHNPHGLGALLHAAVAEQGSGRLGLLLGQAGDREDDAIRALARTAWEARPARIVLKDVDGYMRGRVPGEVPALLREELRRAGTSEASLSTVSAEEDGVRTLIEWARAGDLLVLPVHALLARDAVIALLREAMQDVRRPL